MSNRFGRRIFQLRIKRRLLQKQVAARCGIDASYLAAMEHGRRRPPPDPLLEGLLKALEASDLERSKVRESAALDRLMPLIEAAGKDIRGAEVTSRLLVTLPFLTERQVDAIDALVRALSPNEAEDAMP